MFISFLLDGCYENNSKKCVLVKNYKNKNVVIVFARIGKVLPIISQNVTYHLNNNNKRKNIVNCITKCCLFVKKSLPII